MHGNKYKQFAGLSKKDRVRCQLGLIEKPVVCTADVKSTKRKKSKKRATELVKVQITSEAEGTTVESVISPAPASLRENRKKVKSKTSMEADSSGIDREVKKKRKNISSKKLKTECSVVESTEVDSKSRVEEEPSQPSVVEPGSKRKLAKTQDLRQSLEVRLSGSRFRFINEQLYTGTDTDAVRLFCEDPSAFEAYHKGYKAQLSKWPSDPLDEIISYVKTRPLDAIVADMGCGEARLAKSVKQKVHSFDFVAANKHITACNVTQVPLEDESVDICVFCLSLMTTNLVDYILEANRILKERGLLLIAEIRSRFTSVKNFRRSVEKIGFTSAKLIFSDYFVSMNFEKTGKPTTKKCPGLYLKPCIYKKR